MEGISATPVGCVGADGTDSELRNRGDAPENEGGDVPLLPAWGVHGFCDGLMLNFSIDWFDVGLSYRLIRCWTFL